MYRTVPTNTSPHTANNFVKKSWKGWPVRQADEWREEPRPRRAGEELAERRAFALYSPRRTSRARSTERSQQQRRRGSRRACSLVAAGCCLSPVTHMPTGGREPEEKLAPPWMDPEHPLSALRSTFFYYSFIHCCITGGNRKNF